MHITIPTATCFLARNKFMCIFSICYIKYSYVAKLATSYKSKVSRGMPRGFPGVSGNPLRSSPSAKKKFNK